jgi:peroxiredoxin
VTPLPTEHVNVRSFLRFYMNRRKSLPWAVMLRFLSLLSVCLVAIGPSTALARVGVVVGDFRLPDVYGQERSLSEYAAADAVVVVFLGVECPLAKLYGPRLEAIAKDYSGRNVVVLGVNANRQDSLTELAAYGRRHDITFPLLKDNQAEAVLALGATRTPEVFVLDKQRMVRYQGRIDDQYDVGSARSAPSRHFVREALEAVLVGKEPPTAETRAVGCVIGIPREPEVDAAVTYSEHVAPILEKSCVECHRDGEIAPFALRDYDEVAGWADTIAEVVRDKRMPPWHADPAHGTFANARVLSDAEKQTLYDWAEAGAPSGDLVKLPPQREFVAGWRLPRDPDLVVVMRDEPYRVAAEGVIDYQYFAVDPGFTEDKWIQAADIIPGDRSVVHHVIVFVSPPIDRPRQGLGWLGAYVPGQSSMTLPEGRARFVPAGSKFVFQMHYTPNGAEAEDITRMGLVFADPDSVKEEVVTIEAVNPKFEIPPGEADYHVSASREGFPAGAELIGLAPHMHFRGKSFRMTGVWPDGTQRVLLDVPRYDFNWQTNYCLAKPLTLPASFRVDCEASFDNSAANPANPDPSATVRWGDQSFEEMMVAFFEVASPVGSLKAGKRFDEPAQSTRLEARAVTQRLFEKHDDGDGKLLRRELPHAFALFAFDRYDRNNDQSLTEDEVYESALADRSRQF